MSVRNYHIAVRRDDWQIVPNGFDAVEFAYMSMDLLTDEEYRTILSEAPSVAGLDRPV